jgi:hypothetical protein
MLREILLLVTCLSDIHNLPLHYDTLRQYIHTKVPILPVEERLVPVNKEQSSRADNLLTTQFTVPQYWYNLKALFSTILSSKIATEKMHFGMAQYVDEPQEFWHHRGWASSIRTVSGDFAYAQDGDVLFPGDFVECTPPIRSHGMDANFGRILMIGRDQRSSSATCGQVLLTLQPVVYPNQILTMTTGGHFIPTL